MNTTDIISECEDQLKQKKKWHIELYEIHATTYEIEESETVTSMTKAVIAALDGRGNLTDRYFLEIADAYGMPVEDLEGGFTDQELSELRQSDIVNKDNIIDGVCSIEEITDA